jgi:BioD-like phosphotransacetylase family protein
MKQRLKRSKNVAAVLIVSLTEHEGKTMICAGLGKYWRDSGRQVGYFKPVFSTAEKTKSEEKSLNMVRTLLGLTESVEELNPLLPTDSAAIRAAFSVVSEGKEMVLIEANFAQAERLADATGAGVLVLHDYTPEPGKALLEYAKLSGKLIGVILNKVPASKLVSAAQQPEEALAKAGIRSFGAIPEVRILAAPSVGDLAEVLDGKILNNPEKSSDLIENFMLGSSTFDRGAAYYQRKNNKAVLVWGERPGYRKAALAALPQVALQTSTRCVVISDAAVPLPAILQKATEKGVPLISVPGKLPEVIAKLEKAAASIPFCQEQKIGPLMNVLAGVLKSSLLTGDLSPS